MLTQKDYCDYETRNELIKLGYPAYLYDNTEVDKILGAILLYDAQKWLREEKHLYIEVHWYSNLLYEYKVKEATGETLAVVTAYKTYEEALAEGIKEAVKILKEKEK